MKLRRTLRVTIFAMTCFVVAGAVAVAKDSRNVLLQYDATVAGSHLTSGSYRIKWETHSPQATVSFMRGNKVVATAEGKIVDRGTKYASNQVVYTEASNGERTVQEIRFSGSSEVIVFNE